MKSAYIEPILLNKWLDAKGIDTPQLLSQHLGITTQAAYRLRSGQSQPGPKTLAKLGLRIVYAEVK